MLPHGGTQTSVWKQVCALGDSLEALGEVAGSAPVPGKAAVVFDWDAWWASELDSHPSTLFRYRELVFEWFVALTDAGVTVDVQPLADDLSGYRLVVAPGLYLVSDDTIGRVEQFVAGGGHFVTTFFSGIVDDADRVRPGGYPGAFRDLLGITVEQFGPLLDGVHQPLLDGGSGTLWADQIRPIAADVQALLRYGGERAGEAAVTRRPVGAGSATYVGTRPDPDTLRALAGRLCEHAGVEPDLNPSEARFVLRRERRSADARYVLLLSRTGTARTVTGQRGFELLTGRDVDGELELPPYGVAVLRTRTLTPTA
jgi:beta-galactosidase